MKLPKKIKEKFFVNLKKNLKEGKMSYASCYKIYFKDESFSQALWNAFGFSSTKEGWDYWDEVHNKEYTFKLPLTLPGSSIDSYKIF